MNHDNFTEVTSEDAPKYMLHYDRHLWAKGYNTCLERTNAAELLQCLNDMVDYYFLEKQLDDEELIDMEQRCFNAIKKATDGPQ